MKLAMKYVIILLLCYTVFHEASAQDKYFDGRALYKTVEKFVSLGEHRTATHADLATSEWLGKELRSSGFEVKYLEFPLKQFFLKSAVVSHQDQRFEAFPLWYLKDSISLHPQGVLVTNPSGDVKGKIVLLSFPGEQSGQSGGQMLKRLHELIAEGAAGIIGYADNDAGHIIAFNAPKGAKPWAVPIVVITPSDAKKLQKFDGRNISIEVKGSFREVKGRNVYGKIGNGDKYIVISTPISGWFGCGGERGPGLATWLALAKWTATLNSPYTFVFTGNSGHELGGWGAKAFLEEGAPPVEKTKLWIHLGAGIATVAWNQTPSGLAREARVDPRRNFFYSASVKSSFDPAFKDIQGNKFDVKERAGGELVYVIDKGYTRVAGAAFSHPYFHMKADDATKTSPEILQEVALAFKNLIQNELNSADNE